MEICRKYIGNNIYLFLLLVFAARTFAWSKHRRNIDISGDSLADDTSSLADLNNIRRVENNINLRTLHTLLKLGGIPLNPLAPLEDNNDILSGSSNDGIPVSISNEKNSNELSDESGNNYQSPEGSNDNTFLGLINSDLRLSLRESVDLSLHTGGIAANGNSRILINITKIGGHKSPEQNCNNNGTSRSNQTNRNANESGNLEGETSSNEILQNNTSDLITGNDTDSAENINDNQDETNGGRGSNSTVENVQNDDLANMCESLQRNNNFFYELGQI
ncbi:myb-like protein I isoform X2 [Linepithema humile]|uniref:myb-like protein I isoform X2 n=1 Tax=Linepithema humile TaxID=83485 RepID=UPI00062347FB|nr:PREDICTED: putative uncharacterized protein DDB_G0286901 isoform X2 [Linepithema humile]